MIEPARLARRCDQCAHVDLVRGIHPMRCQHPDLQTSLPVQVMRAGACGIDASLWSPKENRRETPPHP